jgi:hypothetical protein
MDSVKRNTIALFAKEFYFTFNILKANISSNQGYFLCRNAVPEVLSQKDATWNGVPELYFPGIDITNPRLRPNFESLYAFHNILFSKHNNKNK